MLTAQEYEKFEKVLLPYIEQGSRYILTAQDPEWIDDIVTGRVKPDGQAYGFLLNENTDFTAIEEVYQHNFQNRVMYIRLLVGDDDKMADTTLRAVKVTPIGKVELDDYYDVIRKLGGLYIPGEVLEDPYAESTLIQCKFDIEHLKDFVEVRV